jgi:autotransporter-associated beta strand protein
LLSSYGTAFADSATWKLNPTNGDWNTAANWSPSTVPNGPSDTATFDVSNTTGISLSANTEVNGILFDAGASSFTITAPASASCCSTFQLTISGAGITNNSGITQHFVTTTGPGFPNFGVIFFINSATAGSNTLFTNRGNGHGLAQTGFFNNSSAGNSIFINEGGAADGDGGGVTFFRDNATAANGTFTTNGGAVEGAVSGATIFEGNSTAGHGTFINNAGAPGSIREPMVDFRDTSSAGNGIFINNGGLVRRAQGALIQFGDATAANGTFINNGGAVVGAGGAATVFFAGTADNATLIANGGAGRINGGKILLFGASKGGQARVALFGNGGLNIRAHNAPGVTVGSIEGDGLITLGANELEVGSNHLDTAFAGIIRDGSEKGGSIIKIGSGKLVLQHRNHYTGGTTVKHGQLIVNNAGGSGTGSGPVQVNGGKLGGKGTIAGTVTIGTGGGRGANLAPGYLHGMGRAGALTILSQLTFNADGTYQMQINSSDVIADEVVANGVIINAGAQFTFTDLGSGTLPIGAVFTAINNTSGSPIVGTFVNLPDGVTFTTNGNTFKANYEGGNGNDLTLKVQ